MLRISAQLIDVQSQEQLWSEHYDQEYKSPEVVIAIQSDTAQKIAKALRVRLADAEKRQIEKPATALVTGIGVIPYGRNWGTSAAMILEAANA